MKMHIARIFRAARRLFFAVYINSEDIFQSNVISPATHLAQLGAASQILSVFHRANLVAGLKNATYR